MMDKDFWKVGAIGIVAVVLLTGAGLLVVEKVNSSRDEWCKARGYTVTALPGRTFLNACLDDKRHIILPE